MSLLLCFLICVIPINFLPIAKSIPVFFSLFFSFLSSIPRISPTLFCQSEIFLFFFFFLSPYLTFFRPLNPPPRTPLTLVALLLFPSVLFSCVFPPLNLLPFVYPSVLQSLIFPLFVYSDPPGFAPSRFNPSSLLN